MLNNMTTFVADPAQLGTGDALPREIAALAAWVRASPAAADAAQPISLPGEPERRLAAARGRDGIPLPARTHEQLVAAAASVGVAPPR
jgi:LDH2 family malate/lactate/ureidoglycolate dehydrogenase